MNPKNTIFDAKRLIGRKFSEKTVQHDMKTFPFKVVDDGKDNPLIEVFKGCTLEIPRFIFATCCGLSCTVSMLICCS